MNLILKLAEKVFGEVVPQFGIFIRAGVTRGNILPPVEVKFTKADDAEKFRKGSSQRVSNFKQIEVEGSCNRLVHYTDLNVIVLTPVGLRTD